MIDALSIKRKKSAADEFSFERLRREGIGYAQQFSGRLWSDYNLHDPGVTILEQLCYALTDLIHRADFDVADYLAEADGTLDFERLALFRPETIFPARPTTLEDYRNSILEEIMEIDNVWLTKLEPDSKNNHVRGLYHIAIKPAYGIPQEQRNDLIKRVCRYYGTTRNLCEDVAAITIIKDDNYELYANIEVGSGRSPAEIMAEIYFEAAKLISGCRDLDKTRKTIDHYDETSIFFDEPPSSKTLSGMQDEILVSSVFSVITAIPCIENINNIHFEKNGIKYYGSITCTDPETAINLAIPQEVEQIRIRLLENGRELPITISEMRARFDELSFSYYTLRKLTRKNSFIYEFPRGKIRRFTEYFSIQNQFPITYGIGVHGVSDSEPPEIKAKAKQLKSYLMIFEQMMANYLANLDFIKSMFSTDFEDFSYPGFSLDKGEVSDSDQLFVADSSHEINTILSGFDNVYDRKGRLLDYLLSVYGESFPQHSLKNFNYYCNKDDIDKTIVKNKILFLKSIVMLGRDRAAAGDYNTSLDETLHVISGLHQRVILLLGFKQRKDHSLTMAIFKQGLVLSKHSFYEQYQLGQEELILIDLDANGGELKEKVEPLPCFHGGIDINLKSARDLIGNKIPLKNDPVSDLLLRGGIYLERYKIGSVLSNGGVQLLFHMSSTLYWSLGTFNDKSAAINAAHSLRKLLIYLNEESEGIHIVEHVLLRPCNSGYSPCNYKNNISDDFYSFNISVIFPDWSARCHDQQFRMLAEETVILNAPAHINTRFYWLEFHQMYEFETLHEKWSALKRETNAQEDEINSSALNIINFLMDNKSSENKEVTGDE